MTDKARDWIKRNRYHPQVLDWLRRNPPHAEWTGTPLEWAHTEMPFAPR